MHCHIPFDEEIVPELTEAHPPIRRPNLDPSLPHEIHADSVKVIDVVF
jgi:hypothetical protein